MSQGQFVTRPDRTHYDVVVIGGAVMGASVAFHLARLGGVSVLVIDRDPSFETTSTAHTNSCLRQQFSHPLNVRISQDTARYLRNIREELGDDRVPEIQTDYFGYLNLAATPERRDELAANVKMQNALGAATRMMTPDEMAAEWPFLDLDGIVAGAHNPVDEGYFDGGTLFDWWRRRGRALGVTYLHGEVTGIDRSGARVTGVTLADGTRIAAGHVVNAAGPRAGQVAAMADLFLPVEPRKRFTWVVAAAQPLDRPLPLMVDPLGYHARTDGGYYMIGATPDPDPAVAPDDFAFAPDPWEDRVWPALATRVPQFDRLKIVTAWAGHYAYNTVDQNAIVGPHPEVQNFHFVNGFSGHGLQQSPAMGRGVAERILLGRFDTLDLTPFAYDRLAVAHTQLERAVI